MMKNRDVPIYWVIDFKKSEFESDENSNQNGGIPPFDLYIPQDSSDLPQRPKRNKSKYKAIEYLRQIQESCESLKGEYSDTLNRKTEEPYKEQINHIADDIKNLFGIIKEFTKLMQKIQLPPSEDPPGQEKNL